MRDEEAAGGTAVCVVLKIQRSCLLLEILLNKTRSKRCSRAVLEVSFLCLGAL